MGALKNHPGMWLRDDAAASLARLEADHGVLPLTSAGRTKAEQQALIDRWDRGGAYNRPPYLYEPKRPAEESTHVKNGGIAVDTPAIAKMREVGGHYGWWQPYDWDEVHFEYDPARDRTRDNHRNEGAPVSDLQFVKQQLGGSNSRKTSLRQDVDVVGGNVEFVKDQLGGSSNRTTSLRQDVDRLEKKVDQILEALRK